MKKNQPENKPTQWEIGQPSDVFSENSVKIKIPLGLLQRGVHLLLLSLHNTENHATKYDNYIPFAFRRVSILASLISSLVEN